MTDSFLFKNQQYPFTSGCLFEGTLDGSKVYINRVRIFPKPIPQVKEVCSLRHILSLRR